MQLLQRNLLYNLIQKEFALGLAHKWCRLLEKPGFYWRAMNSFFSAGKKRKSIVMYFYFGRKHDPFLPLSFFFNQRNCFNLLCLTIKLSMQHPITNADPLSQKRCSLCIWKVWKGFCGLNVVTYFTALGSMEYFDNCNSSMKLVISSFNYFFIEQIWS